FILILTTVNKLYESQQANKKVATLESEIDTKNTKIEELETDLDNKEKQIVDLEEKVEQAEPWFEMSKKEQERKIAEEKEKEEKEKAAERSEEHTLNSSHVSISYAVFCLKKKKK